MSPELYGIPRVPGDLDYSHEILDNWISAVDSALSDPLAIASVEEWIPPVGDWPLPFRQCTRADLPLVWCRVRPIGAGAHAAACQDMYYEIAWGVVVEGGALKTNARLLSRINENIVSLFGPMGPHEGSTAFLNRSRVSISFSDFLTGPAQYSDSPYVIWADSTMRAAVQMPSPFVE